jgi:hypothetical protein
MKKRAFSLYLGLRKENRFAAVKRLINPAVIGPWLEENATESP